MASATIIPLQHLEPKIISNMVESSESSTVNQPPQSPTTATNSQEGEWEMVPPTSPPVVTFHEDALVEKTGSSRSNPKTLLHSQSSPDLRKFSLAEEEDDDESSAVLVEEESTSSMASSNMVMVSGPRMTAKSVSVASNKLSFRDAILQNKAKPNTTTAAGTAVPKHTKKSFKPKFVVVKPSSPHASSLLRNSKSMGNLRALDHVQEDHYDDEIMGDTDAHDYYSRKSQGALGRQNGAKCRPDEAKRLEITMAKKTLQRQRQMAHG